MYDFLRRYPKVSADVLFVDRVVNMIEEGIDVGIRIAHLKDSSLVATRLGSVRRVVCASDQYLRRHGVPQAPNDIRQHRCVRQSGLAPRKANGTFGSTKREVSIPITSIVTCNEIDSAVNACIDGLGLGMFLSYMVATNRKDGQLEYVLEKFETEPIPVQLVYPSSKLLSTRVRAFIDECVDKLRHVPFE